MRLKTVVLFALTLFVTSCFSSERMVKVDERFSLNAGDKVKVYAAEMQITFAGTGVFENSNGELEQFCTVNVFADGKTEQKDISTAKPFKTKSFTIKTERVALKQGCNMIVIRN